MLSINADDGLPIDERHTALVLQYQEKLLTLEELRVRLRACPRPATAEDDSATPAPEPQSPTDRPCCGR